MLTHDIVISGAGPVGSTLALLLAQRAPRPERIAVVGKSLQSAGRDDGTASAQTGPTPDAPPFPPDPRTLALNHGSRVLLEQLDAWPAHASADIHTVHVSQRSRLGRTLIDRRDMQVERLGSVVAYDALLSRLHARLHEAGVDLIPAEHSTAGIDEGQVYYALGAERLTASVAVQSDGRAPHGVHRDYKQHAVLATAEAGQAQPGWAYERFTRQGPLALLPHPHAGNAYAVVWCCPPEQADRLRAMGSLDFDDALNLHFGDRLGRLRSVGERHVFPLALHAGPALVNARTVAIGNAAQTLHPVAGQGLNLGLRDVAQFAQAITPWLALPHDDARPCLRSYVERRRADRWLTAAITDALPRVFATGNPLVEHACGLALLGLDMFAPARNALAHQLLQGRRI